MVMRKEALGEQLAREAREYLADLQALREDLKSVEGWIVLGLIVLAGLISIAWATVSLGYSPPNDHILSFLYKFGLRICKPIDNFGGVVIFVDLFMLLFLMVISLGNAFNMMRRVREGLPREPRDLIISVSLMIVTGLGGIIFMLWAC
ncbi:MAG: hypothetical protein Q8M20_13700 [Rhodocyclaceae bacterium]|nr:hypothetical protein [Rhodocyclaceae bacterium]MDZ4216054.1 hypothetical protein [Rhodocyclaceae bacterium]